MLHFAKSQGSNTVEFTDSLQKIFMGMYVVLGMKPRAFALCYVSAFYHYFYFYLEFL